MKKTNVIIFDVDNTLFRGNLTFSFLGLLIRDNFYTFRKCFFIWVKTLVLIIWTLPCTIRTLFWRVENLPYLDKKLYLSSKHFYQTIFSTFKKINLLGEQLEKKALSKLSERFLQKHLYHEGINKIKDHLKNKQNIIVLLSGSLQELLDVLLLSICKKLNHEGIDWENRIFAQGTKLGTSRNKITPCIGKYKNLLLDELLKKAGYPNFTIEYIYSDNGLLSDLPLLKRATRGGTLISERKSIYQKLPEELTKMFTFRPYWNKKNKN